MPGLYQGMLEAAQEGDWQQVLEFGQAIRTMDPHYRGSQPDAGSRALLDEACSSYFAV